MNGRTKALRRAGFSLAVAGTLFLLGFVAVNSGLAAGQAPQAAAVACQTIISGGEIQDDTTWTEAGSPYCIRDWLGVKAGVALTIAPGVEIYFARDRGLDVRGVLTAVGAPDKGILFSSESDEPASGDWARLRIERGGRADLAYCEIAYGGGHGHGLWADSSDVTLSNCRIHHNRGNGVYLAPSDIGSMTVRDSVIDHNAGHGVLILSTFLENNRPLVENLVIENNGGAAVYLARNLGHLYWAFPRFQDLTFAGNGSDALKMDAGDILSNLTLDNQAWFHGKPIIVTQGGLLVRTDYTLTLAPGATLLFSEPYGLLEIQNGSAVVAEGAAEQPIVLGPDPDRRQPGAWRGVKVREGGRLRLAHCDIGYAGDDGSGLRIESNDVQARNCRIHHTQGDGVLLWGGGGFTAVLEDTLIDHNTGAAIRELSWGEWPLVGVYRSPTYRNLTFVNNGSDALNLGGNLNLYADRTLDGPGSFNGAPIVLLNRIVIYSPATLTIAPGTTLRFADAEGRIDGKVVAVGTATQPIIFTSNRPIPQPGDWAGIALETGSRLTFCRVEYGGRSDWGPAVFIGAVGVEMRNCWVHHSASDGLAFTDYGYGGPGAAFFENLALTDNLGVGLRVSWPYYESHAGASHLTIARNGLAGVVVDVNSTLAMTNTIIANEAVGVEVTGELSLAHTLWDSNAVKARVGQDGNFIENDSYEGPAAFQADGYHIGCTSAAIGRGWSFTADDIDGELRPQPAGSLPDLGADERECGQTISFAAQKVAAAPRWVVDPQTRRGRFQQEYLVGYYYGVGQAAIPVAVTDTLPAGLDLVSQSAYPPMSFARQGQTLAWRSVQAVRPGTLGVVHLRSQSTTLAPNTVLTNVAVVEATNYWRLPVDASSKLPFVRPLLASPGDGETCYGRFPLTGTAQPLTTVRIFANGNQIAEAIPDEFGVFTVTLNYPSTESWTVTAQACVNETCSGESNAVVLTPQQSFWCPRQSVWTSSEFGVRQFRDGHGFFTTINPEFSLPRRAAAAVLARAGPSARQHLYRLGVSTYPVLNGVRSTTPRPPDGIWVETGDGVRYTPDQQLFPPSFDYIIYDFWLSLPTDVSQTNICIHIYYGGQEYIGCVVLRLTDPDGTVFDVTRGFDPDNPTLTAISGVTVTCMVSMPQWGGWAPWPAHLYNNQVNPQVTGDDGYFAFFTPPGHYYLQVEGKPGYQSWRSPVIEVVTQVVHVNVPLTPWPAGRASQVTLTPFGIWPRTIEIQKGESVEWVSTLGGGDLAELERFTENPVVRPLSSLDPLASTLGWDGGMLTPGQVYRRQFMTEGRYSYTDGAGHVGVVVVRGPRLYLPLVRRN